MSLAYLAAITTSLSILLLFWGLAQMVSAPARAIEKRLDEFATREVPAKPQELQKAGRDIRTDIDRVIRKSRFGESIARELARANLKLTVTEFISFTILSTLLCGFIGYILYYRSHIMGLAGAVVGFYLPRLYVKRRQQSRLKAFNDQLGDAITLLANSLRSGYSLLQAMEAVSQELSPPISEEFARVVYEVGLGLSIQQALNNMLKRVQSDDLDLMITAINIQHEVGGNLAEILDSISSTIRERVRLHGEIRALTAQQRLSGYLVGFLPLALGLIVYLINREYISLLFNDPCGLIMLGVGGFMMIVGFLAMRKATQIEV
ncbi:MAG: secretion system protein [Chloroflexi bacterium]|nr:MAG: secretion system protein [Chloroflexota bacterium]